LWGSWTSILAKRLALHSDNWKYCLWCIPVWCAQNILPINFLQIGRTLPWCVFVW
jgi:hypothetical protein